MVCRALRALAWFAAAVLAAGARASGTTLFRWPAGDLAAGTGFDVTDDTVMGVHPLRDGRVVVGAQDPLLAVLDADGAAVWERRGQIANFRYQTFERSIRLSADGMRVHFGYEYGGGRPAQFNVHTGELRFIDLSDTDLALSDIAAPSLYIANWNGWYEPTLNGTPLPLRPYEESRSLAVVPGGQQFALGADWHLYLFDRQGRQVWRIDAPGVVWSLTVSGDGRLVVAAFADGTIRWYDRRTGAERLALFPHADGERWIAWTPEGFYNASPGGEDLIGYLLNRGAEQEPLFVTGAQIREVFFRPDLVARALDDDRSAIAQAVASAGDIRAVLLGDGPPPEVALAGPAEVALDGTTYELRLTVTDRGGGIGSLEIRVNGAVMAPRQVEMPRAPEGRRAGRIRELTALLELPPGRHRVEAAVGNDEGTARSERAAAEVVVPGEATRVRLHALVVGVDDYRDDRFDLEYAAGDAHAVADLLHEAGGPLFAGTPRIERLTDRQVTVAAIEAAVDRMAADIAPSDVFVLYLAGHGLTGDNGRYHFLPSDFVYANDEALRDRTLSEERLVDLVARVPALKMLVILDTCHAGGAIDGLTGEPWARVASARAIEEVSALRRLDRATGRAVLAATTELTVALEGYDGHGVFTYALLRGLEGAADAEHGNRDGVTDINELSAYIEDMVPRLTLERWNSEQFPMRALNGQSFPIAVHR